MAQTNRRPPGSRACPKCGIWHWRSHAYCERCFADYMAEWRYRRPLVSLEEIEKIRVRGIARQAVKKGLIPRLPCKDCGHEPAQMHHEDYSRPLEVVWLCRSCHTLRHQDEAKTQGSTT